MGHDRYYYYYSSRFILVYHSVIKYECESCKDILEEILLVGKVMEVGMLLMLVMGKRGEAGVCGLFFLPWMTSRVYFLASHLRFTCIQYSVRLTVVSTLSAME